MNEGLGKFHFWITFIGVYCIFVPMHTMGMVGMPRRFAQFTEYEYPGSRCIPWWSSFPFRRSSLCLVQFLFYFNLFWSIFKGKKASDNPWEATTLEWITTQSASAR